MHEGRPPGPCINCKRKDLTTRYWHLSEARATTVLYLSKMHMHSKMITICRMCEALFRKSLEMSNDTEATSSKRKLRKYDTAIDTSCAFETNDFNLSTANFDSYGNVSFDPCKFTLHTAVNAS